MACPKIAIELTPVQADPSGSCVLLICSPFICVLIFFQFILGACETLLLQSSVSLMNDFPDISITPPLHQFSDQQPLQMVYVNQIYQCVRLYLIEESVNFKFLKIVMLFTGGIHWQNANVKELILWVCLYRIYLSIYLSIHPNFWKELWPSIISLDQYWLSSACSVHGGTVFDVLTSKPKT